MTAITAETSAPARRRKLVGAGRRQWIGLLYVAPAVALVTVFFIVPLAMTAWMSLNNWPLMGEHSYIGLGNYWAILRDTRFWNALRFTGWYTLVVTIAIFAVAFPLAIFIERPRAMTNVYRTAFFM
ncbi:MAG: sugar ABC transporter permease, partial [Mesorhizobium sp.]